MLKSATADGSSLVISDCNSNADQLWAIEPWDGSGSNLSGCFNILNFNAYPKILGVLGGNPTDGAQAVIGDPLGHLDQVWCLS